MKKVLIVGAGISGATCARILAENNNKITIIEKNAYIGGSCFDYLSEDSSCYIHKFGPHIFHTNNESVWKFITRFSSFNNYVHCVYTKVNNSIFTFPINLNVISNILTTEFDDFWNANILETELKNLDIKDTSDAVNSYIVIVQRNKKIQKDFFSAAEYLVYAVGQEIEIPYYKEKRKKENKRAITAFISGKGAQRSSSGRNLDARRRTRR
jgi:UDP-galactopyranose mutase